MAYFQYNIFVTIAGFSSYLAFSVCGPYHFAQAQSASNTECVNTLNEAKETCEHSPEVQITYPSPSDGLAVMSESQISNAIINEARFAAKAKECDKAINICESQCPQASNPGGGFGDRDNGPSSGTKSICRETLSSYYEAYLAESERYRSEIQRFQAIKDAASAPPPTPTPSPDRSPTSDTNETQNPPQRIWGFGNF